MKRYRLDNFTWELKTDKNALEHGRILQDYFEEFEIDDTSCDVQLSINIKDCDLTIDDLSDTTLQHFSLSGSIGFNENSIGVKDKLYSYAVIDAFDKAKTTKLNVSFRSLRTGVKTRIIQAAKNILVMSTSHMTHIEKAVDTMMVYKCFWWVLAVTLLKQKTAFVHGGMLEYNNKGILLAGTGGCGKTSISFEMIQRLNDCKYLVDDFCLVSHDGYLIANPKPFTIYQSDVKWGNKILSRYVNEKMDANDRKAWMKSKKRGQNPRRRVRRNEMFAKNELKEKVKLSQVFFLSRIEKNTNIASSPISNEDLVKRMMWASFREFKPLYDILCNVHAVGWKQTNIPTMEVLMDEFSEVYASAISSSENKLVSLPLDAEPAKVVDTLFKHEDNSDG